MSLNGQINVVENADEFFAPIVLGAGQPTSGYGAAENNQGLVVIFHGSAPMFEFFGGFWPFVVAAPVSTTNGTFSLPTELFEPLGLNQAYVTLNMNGYQFYRSDVFNPNEVRGGLNIFVYQPTLPQSAGVTAGMISGVLQGQSLPGNTQLTVTPWGLGVTGSESQANIQFGVQIVPDRSPNLGVWLDVAINGWNVNVGWPESWCESAGDIVNSIKSAIQTAGSSVNKVVEQEILNTLQGAPLNLTSNEANTIFDDTSFQFVSLNFDDNYSWPLSNGNDRTVVLKPNVAIGYPRGW